MPKTPSVEQQLAELGLEMDANGRAVKRAGGKVVPPPAPKRKPANVEAKRQPNKTEARLEQRLRCLFDDTHTLKYEAFTFNLAAGYGYKPDWTVWKGNTLLYAYEAKGAFRFGSQARSIVAFRQAALEWPEVKFVLCQWKGGEWRIAGADEPAENLL